MRTKRRVGWVSFNMWRGSPPPHIKRESLAGCCLLIFSCRQLQIWNSVCVRGWSMYFFRFIIWYFCQYSEGIGGGSIRRHSVLVSSGYFFIVPVATVMSMLCSPTSS